MQAVYACMTPVAHPSPIIIVSVGGAPYQSKFAAYSGVRVCVIACTVVRQTYSQHDHCLICLPPTEARAAMEKTEDRLFPDAPANATPDRRTCHGMSLHFYNSS